MGTSMEMQAVIMASGKGSRMTELTVKKPKCLLPIGNFPMVFYPFQLLERSGFQEVLIVIPEPNKSEIQSVLERCSLNIKFELVGIPAGEDWGTADSLRYLVETGRVRADVLVVSCDLITNASLAPLFDLHRKHDSTITAMFVQSSNKCSNLTIPGPKTKHKTERDFVGIHKGTSRLVLLTSSSDYEEELPLSCKFIKHYGQFTIFSKLLDAHVYIISRWLCSYLGHNKSLSTIKGELLPYVLKKHLSKLSKTNQIVKGDDKASTVGVDIKTEMIHFAQESELTHKVRSMSSYTDSRCQPVYGNDSARCYAHIYDNSTYVVRANTLQNYWQANREILNVYEGLINNVKLLVNISPIAVINSTQLDSSSCIIGEKTTVAEKTSLKTSTVGAGVQISPRTTIQDSLIMSGVKIDERCTITNCIVCEDSVIGENCQLINCLIGSHHIVPPSSRHTNEILTEADRLMEI